MSREIIVTPKGTGDPLEFDVVVREGKDETRHQVTMSKADHQKIGGRGVTPERCVEAAFAFLLDREPKESILNRFDVGVIRRYFPDFDQQIGAYLSQPGA